MRLPFVFLTAFVFGAAWGQNVVEKSPAEKRREAFWKSIGTTYDDTYRAAAKLKAGKPVDDLQASLLASAYFSAHISGCGQPSLPEDRGSYWFFTSKVGYAAAPGPSIRVEKATGVTSCKGKPTVRDPRDYLKYMWHK